MPIIKVFVENQAGSDQKNLFDEKTFDYKKTITVSRKYPYPYGFIPHTTSGDGDNVDCFIITNKELETGVIVECEPIGMMIQKEDGKEDNNILAVLKGERSILIDETIKDILTDFVNHVFDHRKGKTVEVGGFLHKDHAEEFIKQHVEVGGFLHKDHAEEFIKQHMD